MLLAAFCCEGHQIVAHAIAHGAVPVHAAGFDTLLYFAVQELIRSLMPSPTKRFILRPHDDGVVLYCLSHGNQHCVVAAPREPERAFAAFGFLADLQGVQLDTPIITIQGGHGLTPHVRLFTWFCSDTILSCNRPFSFGLSPTDPSIVRH